MNKAIAHILKEALLGLPFIDRYGGLVAVQERGDMLYDEEGTAPPQQILTRFPVTADYTLTDPDCPVQQLVDFIPDEKYKGMLYFEDGGVEPAGREGRMLKFTSRLQLVGWLNTRGIVAAAGNAAIEEHLVSTLVQAAIQKKLSAIQNSNSAPFVRIRPVVSRIQISSPAIFQQYTYNVLASQFLMPPFEYFAMQIATEFRLPENCAETLATIPVQC